MTVSNGKEIVSMSSQLSHCYAYNRRSLKTLDLWITSLCGRLGERMDTVMHGVHRKWRGIEVSSDGYDGLLNTVAKEDLVYLTADSDNVIESLDTKKVYIIGGIVDKNRYKVGKFSFSHADPRVCVITKPCNKGFNTEDCLSETM